MVPTFLQSPNESERDSGIGSALNRYQGILGTVNIPDIAVGLGVALPVLAFEEVFETVGPPRLQGNGNGKISVLQLLHWIGHGIPIVEITAKIDFFDFHLGFETKSDPAGVPALQVTLCNHDAHLPKDIMQNLRSESQCANTAHHAVQQ